MPRPRINLRQIEALRFLRAGGSLGDASQRYSVDPDRLRKLDDQVRGVPEEWLRQLQNLMRCNTALRRTIARILATTYGGGGRMPMRRPAPFADGLATDYGARRGGDP